MNWSPDKMTAKSMCKWLPINDISKFLVLYSTTEIENGWYAYNCYEIAASCQHEIIVPNKSVEILRNEEFEIRCKGNLFFNYSNFGNLQFCWCQREKTMLFYFNT